MVDIHVENHRKDEGRLEMHMGICGFKDDVELEIACIPAAMLKAYVQRMQQDNFIRKEIREDVLALSVKIDRGIRAVISELVKEGDL